MTIEKELAIGAILGAGLSASKRRGVPFSQRVIETVGGAATAYYGTLALMYYYKYPIEVLGTVGFFVGVIGMEATSVIMEVAPGIIREIIARLSKTPLQPESTQEKNEDK